ncbi:MAG: hypothetical protein ACKO6F_09255, partial [Cyanobium sp.]
RVLRGRPKLGNKKLLISIRYIPEVAPSHQPGRLTRSRNNHPTSLQPGSHGNPAIIFSFCITPLSD